MSTPTNGRNSAKSADPKGAKFNSKSFAANFAPGFTLNVNAAGGRGAAAGAAGAGAPGGAQGGRGAHAESLLPEPDFTSPAAVRHYCNSLRALMTGMAFEIAMGAEIMQGVLAQVPDPQGRIGGSKVRAWRVSRKLAKSADAARDAAKNAAATYAKFAQEYEEEINRVRHRARRPHRREMDWAQQ